jgi:hypothetical protein
MAHAAIQKAAKTSNTPNPKIPNPRNIGEHNGINNRTSANVRKADQKVIRPADIT